MKARVESRGNGCISTTRHRLGSRAQISAKCCSTPWPRAIRDPRLSFVPPRRRDSRLVPLDRKTRHGKKILVNFLYTSSCISRSRRRKTRRSRDWPSHGGLQTRRTGILVAITTRAHDEPECRTIGNPDRFFHYHEDLDTTAPVTTQRSTQAR